MSQQLAPYCVLAPNMGTGGAIALTNFGAVMDQLALLADEHAKFVGEHRKEWGDHIREMEVGFSFSLTNQHGGVALVGVSESGWVIFQITPAPTKRVPGTLTGRRVIAMLLPERTEFHESELVPAAQGRTILRRWLDGNSAALVD